MIQELFYLWFSIPLVSSLDCSTTLTEINLPGSLVCWCEPRQWKYLHLFGTCLWSCGSSVPLSRPLNTLPLFPHRALITRRLILMIRQTGAAVSQLGVPFSITSCQDAFVSLWNNCLSSCQSDWLLHKKGCSLPAHRGEARRNCNLLNWRFDSSIPNVNVHFSSFTSSAFWCIMCKRGA